METVCEDKVVFFSKADCDFCEKLESDLKALDISYTKVLVTDVVKPLLIAHTSCLSVPQLFIGKKFIGGYREFSVLCATNRLEAELHAIGHKPPQYDF